MRVFKAAKLVWIEHSGFTEAMTDLVRYRYEIGVLSCALASSGFSEWEDLGYTDSVGHAQAQAQAHFEVVLATSGLVKELR